MSQGEQRKRLTPIVQALLIADHIYRDAQTGKHVLAGTFNTIQCESFPAIWQQPVFIYLSITGVHGQVDLVHRLVDLQNHAVILETEPMPVTAATPLDTAEVVGEVQGLPFPHSGTYALELHHEGELLSALRISVVEVKPPEPTSGEA
ncbi:MAG: hypothetical protein U1E76_09215 [Planctomycetota bacterium]